MFAFFGIFAVALVVLLLVQGMDIECANPPKQRRPKAVKPSTKPEAVRQVAKHVFENAMSTVR